MPLPASGGAHLFSMHLIATDISHGYDGLTVLDKVGLDVADGEIVCVIGPSGCGKSTLLRLLGGLERPDSGSITATGNAPEDCLNPFTYVFQDFALLPWRTAAGNISLALEEHPLSEAERRERINDVLARTNLSDFADAYPKQLSGGMKQRVAIARALAVRPAVWLLDEPLSALDAQTRELLMDDLINLWNRTRFAAVYVTHNLSEAVRLGHRIVVLSRRPGRVREVISVDQPITDRQPGSPELETMASALWSLLKAEASEADRELANG